MGLPEFDLHRLGWHDFQQLCHTIAREVLGQTVESFLNSRDGGRDGAFTGLWTPRMGEAWTGRFVIQCKHTSKADRNLSLTELTDELAKTKRLVEAGRCDIYVLMTNLGISGTTEAELSETFSEAGVAHFAVWGSTWINQTIAENSRLRRLVPRLYGLGDLSQILDERAYGQAAAVLDSMRSDLVKLVRTGTYERAARSVDEDHFVLLLGQPATGKTTIAAQLALAAIDGYRAALIKLEDAAEFGERWNPEEPSQLFWLDDAFGVTQFDVDLANHWTRTVPRIHAALERGARFILTSRDYIYEAARPNLKPGSFPLLDESKVVVDVRDLTGRERRQMLYNHLKHGNQARQFLIDIHPHLEELADHPGFTPELARRLAQPALTKRVIPNVKESVEAFFSRPREYLEDIVRGLDDDAKTALGLIYINRNRLRSPVKLTPLDEDLVTRLGSDLGGVTRALEALNGSLVILTYVEGHPVWSFSHPTMSDAYGSLLQTPELLTHLAAGFPLHVLLRQTTCGDVGIESAIVLPPSAYGIVLSRLDEPLPEDWRRRWEINHLRMTYLARRVGRSFLTRYLERHPDLPQEVSVPGTMLDADPTVDVALRLWREDLLPEANRAQLADTVITYCVTGQDPGVLEIPGLRDILTADEEETLRRRLREELVPALDDVLAEWESSYHYYQPDPPEPYDHMSYLKDLLSGLENEFPDEEAVRERTEEINAAIDHFIVENALPDPDYESGDDWHLGQEQAPPTTSTETRSMFDDLLD